MRIGDKMSKIWEHIQARKTSRSGFGLRAIDKYCKGICHHEILTIGARTSHGKTVFATQLALEWLEQGKKVILFSNEHSREYVKVRMSSQYLNKHTADDILEANVPDEEKEIYTKFWDYLDTLPLRIYDKGEGKTLQGAQIAYQDFKPDIIIIDHIQMLKDNGGTDFRRIMNSFLNGIKSLVERNPVAVVLISQCSRRVAERRYFLPSLVDLKESGSIEDLSDIIFLLSWPWKSKQAIHTLDKKAQEDDFGEQQFFVDIAKNRNGQTKCVEVRFNTEILKFQDWEIMPPQKDVYSD
jgi:replicative DNA helicase